MAGDRLKSFDGLVVSTSVIADITGLTQRRVRQLAEEKVMEKTANGRYELVPVIRKYIMHLRAGTDTKQGRSKKEQVKVDLESEKALHERAKREKAELALAEMRGKMHQAEDVERVMNDMLGAFRAKLLGMPSKIAPVLIARNEIAVIQELLQKEIYEALQELAEYDPAAFYSDKFIDRDDGDNEEQDEG